MMASSTEDRAKILELKEEAKWAQNSEKMKKAVTELATYGEKAIPILDEIKYVTVHEEVKSACIGAIKTIRGAEEQRQQPAEPPSGAADKSAAAEKQEEEQKEKEKKKKG